MENTIKEESRLEDLIEESVGVDIEKEENDTKALRATMGDFIREDEDKGQNGILQNVLYNITGFLKGTYSKFQ